MFFQAKWKGNLLRPRPWSRVHFATYGRNEFPKAVTLEPLGRSVSPRGLTFIGPTSSKPLPVSHPEKFPELAFIGVTRACDHRVGQLHFYLLPFLELRFRWLPLLHRKFPHRYELNTRPFRSQQKQHRSAKEPDSCKVKT